MIPPKGVILSSREAPEAARLLNDLAPDILQNKRSAKGWGLLWKLKRLEDDPDEKVKGGWEKRLLESGCFIVVAEVAIVKDNQLRVVVKGNKLQLNCR